VSINVQDASADHETPDHEAAHEAAHAPGLRERKREALRAHIEEVAVALCSERGYDEVTVEMICDAADVSPRTFFNYFGTKEVAVIGDSHTMFDDDVTARFIANERPILDSIADLIDTEFAARGRAQSRALVLARHELLVRTPSLLVKQMAAMAKLDDVVTDLVLARLRARPADRLADSAASIEEQARMIAILAGGAARFAFHVWLMSDAATPRALDVASAFSLMTAIAKDNQ
jgi:AcrR family transcriptional regulator